MNLNTWQTAAIALVTVILTPVGGWALAQSALASGKARRFASGATAGLIIFSYAIAVHIIEHVG